MLKNFHIMLAYLTTLGFVVRGLWSILDSPLRNQKWIRIIPHVIDTLLLVLGVTMAINIGASLTSGWLAAKLIGLLGYIGFGVLAMRARTVPLKILGYVAALGCVVYIFGVAFTRTPLPLA
ncbi:MAG: SirB2 family protein, partial [Pseudomonadales bacterium]